MSSVMQTAAPASADIYRQARLALLGMQTRQQIERTDARVRKVEAALARLQSDREIKAD
jgi:multidrug resistance efflux pump